MRIARTTTAVLEANDDWTIVRIERDGGANGRGESFCAARSPGPRGGSTARTSGFWRVLSTMIAP